MNQYSKDIHNKSNEIARELLPKLAENVIVLVPDVTEDQEGLKALQEKTLDFGNEIVQYLATKDIPARYATMGIEKLVDALNGLKTFIDGTLTMYEDEYLSRSFGVKNTEGKYRRENATIATIVSKLDEARKSTGDKRWEFFNETAPEMPKVEENAVETPYAEK